MRLVGALAISHVVLNTALATIYRTLGEMPILKKGYYMPAERIQSPVTLASCPFCGGAAKLFFIKEEHPYVHRVACIGDCKTAYGISYSYSESHRACADWNRRASDYAKCADDILILDVADDVINKHGCIVSILKRHFS